MLKSASDQMMELRAARIWDFHREMPTRLKAERRKRDCQSDDQLSDVIEMATAGGALGPWIDAWQQQLSSWLDHSLRDRARAALRGFGPRRNRPDQAAGHRQFRAAWQFVVLQVALGWRWFEILLGRTRGARWRKAASPRRRRPC